MLRGTWRWGWLVGLLAVMGARADDRALWSAISDSVVPMVALGELGMYADGAQGQQAAWKGLQALGINFAETEALKSLVGERRPDSNSHDSFPSLHTSTAFTMATVINRYQPDYGPIAFAGAALIGYSRIELDRHHWQDVIGGAALGYLNGTLFAPHHFQVTPVGVTFSTSF